MSVWGLSVRVATDAWDEVISLSLCLHPGSFFINPRLLILFTSLVIHQAWLTGLLCSACPLKTERAFSEADECLTDRQ